MYKSLAAFLDPLINIFFLLLLFFITFFYIKIQQLNITKLTKKDYKKGSRKISKSFKEGKEKKQQCGHEPYKKLPEDGKQQLAEYRKKY